MPWYLGNSRHLMPLWLGFSLPFILVWSGIWKGLALWHAARREEKGWFIALLIINTVGILEIIYLTLVAKIFSASGPPRKHGKR